MTMMKDSSQFVVWLTGLPGSGKTTISGQLFPALMRSGIRVEKLDGDIVRKELSPELGYSIKDRELHAKRVVYLCKLLSKNGVASIVSLISPLEKFRDYAREQVGEGFVEVYVKCSIHTCISRDPKGLYKRALAGEIKNMTGLDDPYEPPKRPEVIVDTEKYSIQQCVETIVDRLADLGYLRLTEPKLRSAVRKAD